MTFYRLVAPLASHVDNPSISHNTGLLCGLDETRDRAVQYPFNFHFPIIRPLVHMNLNPQWPRRSWNFARIRQSVESWPPLSGSVYDWVNDSSVPMVPKGKGSLVVLVATLLPVASFRFACIGPDYLRACVLLSRTMTQPPSVTESLRSQSESSFIFVDEESS